MNKKRNLPKIFAICSVGFFLLSFTLALLSDNENIEYERFNISGNIGANTEIKIAHLSDLHFPNVKVNTNKLVEALIKESPDIIAITGDLIDSKINFEKCGVTEFITNISGIAPIYFIPGNHDLKYKSTYEKLTALLTQNNVTILDDTETIKINDFSILLVHDPKNFTFYNADLVLAGHVHGGQWRAFGKGLLAPSLGLFPKYDSGLYKNGNSTMILSRGIGSSFIPFRINNKPHVPIIIISNV